MSTFDVSVHQIDTIENHPNADRLDLAGIGDYRCIVMRDQYKAGDWVAYIPEAAILPLWLIQHMGLEGRLAGKAKNRVKAVKLRGVLSQGLVLPVYVDGISQDMYIDNEHDEHMFVGIGTNVAEHLGIEKYIPVIPTCMGGEVENAFGYTIKYDIENIKRFPTILNDGEEVVMTEKLHGTWVCYGYHPEVTHPIVTSKGLSEKGLIFKFNEANDHNLYMKAYKSIVIEGDDLVTTVRRMKGGSTEPFYIMGEVFGQGVQDLTYGINGVQFAAFDVYVGEPGHGKYMNYTELQVFCSELDIEMVPNLYVGPYNKETMLELTNGNTTVGGSHIREGIVVKPTTERNESTIGRVQLKSVSDAYLLRRGKNGETPTEFN